MRPEILKLIFRSLVFYRKNIFSQAVVIIILSGAITGSLLTGFSVRSSLKETAVKNLGNAGYVISSGLRYFDASVDGKFAAATGVKATSVLEIEGNIQKFDTGNVRENVKIFGISNRFFAFHETNLKYIGPGEAAVNEFAAARLKLQPGDEIILTHKQVGDLPANSPFSPSAGEISSHVFRVKYILKDDEMGNFSLGINQASGGNLFVNLNDISKTGSANRILVDYRGKRSEDDLYSKLKSVLTPSDIGLKARKNIPSGSIEVTSARIFLDQNIIDRIREIIPGASPVITYLVNSTKSKTDFNPYSFASGLPANIYPEIPPGRKILVNRWLSDDLNVKPGDTVTLRWFVPERITDLAEREETFEIAGIVDMEGKWDDPYLMPDFPGITGQVSCSRWDAGVRLRTELIRPKDEDYWTFYQGTPKIFVSYETGKQLWGNNFGPATAIRIPGVYDENDVLLRLTGTIDPAAAGFRIMNVRDEIIKAASGSVDFSSLFLGLGFFIIISCLMLLALSVSSFLEKRREEIFLLFATGYNYRTIISKLLAENFIITATSSLAGAIAGILFNHLSINALNSVWSGAVNTSSLSPYSHITPLLTGFLVTLVFSSVVQYFKIKESLTDISEKKSRLFRLPGRNKKVVNLIPLLLIAAGLILLFAGSLLKDISVFVSYLSGGLIFAGMILAFRNLITSEQLNARLDEGFLLSRRYYGMYPSRAILPVMLVASGLFAVIATGVNRLEITEKSISPSGGTGGFLLWAETSVPVRENLNSNEGRKKHGLVYDPAGTITFLQARKLQGDDASCLNLNHVSSPPVLGIDNDFLSENKVFSFESLLPVANENDPWSLLGKSPGENTIYGFADQTVLRWGLKKSPGDTLIYVTESGDRLNIIIAGGLKASVFQGYLLTGISAFSDYFPSVPGASVFLVSGKKDFVTDYVSLLNARFENYGIVVTDAKDRLSSFFTVTNTYLSVFMVLGAFGMVLGVVGLGFVLRQNYRFRRREFGLLLALGYESGRIRRTVISEQIVILVAGIVTGFAGALTATIPITGGFDGIPWVSVILIAVSVIIAGLTAILSSLKSIRKEPLVASLRRE